MRAILVQMAASAGISEEQLTSMLAQHPNLAGQISGDSSQPFMYVSPSINGWVGVLDRVGGENEPYVDKLGKAVSRDLKTVMLFLYIYDGDFLIYRLYKNGKLVDRYNSWPDYFDNELGDDENDGPRQADWGDGADPAAFAAALGRPELAAPLADLLVPSEIDDEQEFDSHPDAINLAESIGELLGIAEPLTDYNSLVQNDPNWPVERRVDYLAVSEAEVRPQA
jgi:hypothetical protein